MDNNHTNCCSQRKKERSTEEHKALTNRLSRIEGQIRGIKSMVEKDAYCTDIILQVEAVRAALGSFNRELISAHVKGCVSSDIREGKEDSVEELLQIITKMMR